MKIINYDYLCFRSFSRNQRSFLAPVCECCRRTLLPPLCLPPLRNEANKLDCAGLYSEREELPDKIGLKTFKWRVNSVQSTQLQITFSILITIFFEKLILIT